MKKYISILILLIPLFLVITVNEYTREVTNEKGNVRKGIVGINSGVKLPYKCTWYCHTDTGYCKRQHTNLLKSYTHKIDPVYFGIIKSLHSAGDYGLANIIFLVVLIPLFMFLLLIKSISIQRKIMALKKT